MKNDGKTHELYSFGSKLGKALGQIWKTLLLLWKMELLAALVSFLERGEKTDELPTLQISKEKYYKPSSSITFSIT